MVVYFLCNQILASIVCVLFLFVFVYFFNVFCPFDFSNVALGPLRLEISYTLK